MTFYLGAPEPPWLETSRRPLMVSHTRLRRIRTLEGLPLADTNWLLDPGAYDMIIRHGGYLDNTETYVRAVRRYHARIGRLVWAGPQDWPCEAKALAASGASIREHGRRSALSYVECTAWWERLAPQFPSPFRPIVQGGTAEEYLRCWDEFERLGVDMATQPLIAVGSMCRRERTEEIQDVVTALRERTSRRLHGYGVKADAAELFDDVDSMAWSDAARHRRTKNPACTAWHQVCTSCLVEAEDWHDRMLTAHPKIA